MITETKTTCATCPLARHFEGDKYICDAVHNHHNPVTRGHWQSTVSCDRAIEELQSKGAEDADADYVMALEASLEQSEVRAIQRQQFSQVAATTVSHGIEIDSIKSDSYRVWVGMNLLGTMRRTSKGWLARPNGGSKSWHSTPGKAQEAVVSAALSY